MRLLYKTADIFWICAVWVTVITPLSTCASLYLCRLVEGFSLKTWLQDRSSSAKADNEEQMLAVAPQMFNVRRVKSTEMLSAIMQCNLSTCCSCVQLHQIMSSSDCLYFHQTCDHTLQTLNHMHVDSKICHLDTTPGNIMLQSSPANPWDSVRLIDFGFATKFNPGEAPDRHQSAGSCLVGAVSIIRLQEPSYVLTCCHIASCLAGSAASCNPEGASACLHCIHCVSFGNKHASDALLKQLLVWCSFQKSVHADAAD